MRRFLVTLVIAACAALAAPPPATAGGPTSVLVTDPGTGRAAALYYSDPRYGTLDTVLAGALPLEEEPSEALGPALNLTWMVHDVQPWRTQQLHLDAQGGPLVVTYGGELTGDSGRVTWSRVTDADALAGVLDSVLRQRPTSDAAAEAEVPAPEPVVTERVVRETAWFSLDGWRWLLPGLAVGAGLALLVARRRTDDTGPRQVLTDVAPEPSTSRG
jgi:hypothetical protein